MKALHKHWKVMAVAAVAGFGMAGAADAADYSFSVLYSGNGNATVAPGSTSPIGTVLQAGDSFTYTLTGVGGVYYTTAGGDIFPFIALEVAEPGHRLSDFTVALSYLGAPVFDYSEVNALNAEVHIGANTVTLPGNLVFDTITLSETLVSALTLDDTADTTTTLNSLLPIFGSPEFNGSVVQFGTAPVPEAATWAMFIGGFGLAGAAMRRRRTTVRFA